MSALYRFSSALRTSLKISFRDCLLMVHICNFSQKNFISSYLKYSFSRYRILGHLFFFFQAVLNDDCSCRCWRLQIPSESMFLLPFCLLISLRTLSQVESSSFSSLSYNPLSYTWVLLVWCGWVFLRECVLWPYNWIF